jgi:hypothetical protein
MAGRSMAMMRFRHFVYRSKKWVVNCRREDFVKYDAEKLHTNIRLCSAHFEEEMFVNALKKG